MKNNFVKGIAAIATLVLFAGLFFFSSGIRINYQDVLGASVPTPVALFETSLANSISSSATSMTLVSATDKEGNVFAGETYGFIIDEGTANEEFVLATCTSTSCTSMTRGVSVRTGNTSVASLQKSHRRGASVKITDAPLLLVASRMLNGTETITNKLSYTSNPTFIAGSNELASVKYIDDIAIAGSPDSTTSTKGIGRVSVAPASASIPIFVGDNDPRVPSQDENNALVGTSGTPSTSNKFVTNDDTSNTIVANKVARFNAGGTGITGLPPAVDVQEFLVDGTWTKPSGAKAVRVLVMAGGGGGAGQASASSTTGASGGGGGALSDKILVADDLASTVAVTVGAGGTAGTGASGGAGGTSSFGTHVLSYGGGGGFKVNSTTPSSGGGGGGVGSAGATGQSNASSLGGFPNNATVGLPGAGGGGAGGVNNSAGLAAEYGGGSGGGSGSSVGQAGGDSLYGGAGGGAGGEIGQTGGAGGNKGASNGGGAAGGAGVGSGTANPGSAGTAGDIGAGTAGQGGGGGGGTGGGVGGAGGAGGFPGGGGGGGGAGTTGNSTGGVGGAGQVIVITYF